MQRLLSIPSCQPCLPAAARIQLGQCLASHRQAGYWCSSSLSRSAGCSPAPVCAAGLLRRNSWNPGIFPFSSPKRCLGPRAESSCCSAMPAGSALPSAVGNIGSSAPRAPARISGMQRELPAAVPPQHAAGSQPLPARFTAQGQDWPQPPGSSGRLFVLSGLSHRADNLGLCSAPPGLVPAPPQGVPAWNASLRL